MRLSSCAFFQRAVEPCRVGRLGRRAWLRGTHLAASIVLTWGSPLPGSCGRWHALSPSLGSSTGVDSPLRTVALALGFLDDANCHRLLRQTLGGSPSRDMPLGEMHRVEEAILAALVASGGADDVPTCF